AVRAASAARARAWGDPPPRPPHAPPRALPPPPLLLEADRTRLTQILTNLLHNAARYTPPGGHIAVRAAREADHAVVTVADSGIGIAADRLDAIFDLFTQTAAQRSSEGLGIRL